MEPRYITLKGVRQHNLKNVDVSIPRNKLVVITGLSGSGKSSLAFDTLYAEGQRRYVESLSAYARQFLGIMEKPSVESIEGLSPAIAIEQRKSSRNPRSTVATTTEIYDYMRLLFARVGTPHCPDCGTVLENWTVDQIVDRILVHRGKAAAILSPVVVSRKGEFAELFSSLVKRGFVRARVDGETVALESAQPLAKYSRHEVDVVVDRLDVREENRSRIAESVETALRESDGLVTVVVAEEGDATAEGQEGEEFTFSEKLACPKCYFSLTELEPRLFSFNSPFGACPACHGLGVRTFVDPNMLVHNEELSILEGTVVPWGDPGPFLTPKMERLAKEFDVDPDKPWSELPEDFRNMVIFGNREGKQGNGEEGEGVEKGFEWWEAAIPYVWRRYKSSDSEWVREELEHFMVKTLCTTCSGTRLNAQARSVLVGGKSISDVGRVSVSDALLFFKSLEMTKRQTLIADQILKELVARLGFLEDVGLQYLTLDRATETLSGGEEQRVRLATQIGSGLAGVLYILDEPSIGLHLKDTGKLLATLSRLRDIGNSIIVVEHDAMTMKRSDWIIDLGPGAGDHGGKVIFEGTYEEALEAGGESLTCKYLTGEMTIEMPERRRKPTKKEIIIRNARANNLKNLDVRIPLGLFVAVTGVSGSGKSTLIIDTLHRALMRELHGSREPAGEHDGIDNITLVNKVVSVDQSPIGRTPRSNPATYTGVFTPIRELYAKLRESSVRGYTAGRFSFNVKGGRCEACQGDGYNRIEMQFLPDVYVPCEVCMGKRYNRETLEVKYRGKSIADVLGMSVDECISLFSDVPTTRRKLELLSDVGLGYIKLGQSATTLSGGEAQRVKLAKELSKVATGKTIYILDEPTTGLHFDDVRKLISVVSKLVDKGNTVIVIEHNPDVIKCVDWIIDLGPEGGEEGGYIVAEGSPEEVAKVADSATGKFLATLFAKGVTGVAVGAVDA